jgi:hypothetical protein
MHCLDWIQGETGSVALASALAGGVFFIVFAVVYGLAYILPWIPFVLGGLTAAALEDRQPRGGQRRWLL